MHKEEQLKNLVSSGELYGESYVHKSGDQATRQNGYQREATNNRSGHFDSGSTTGRLLDPHVNPYILGVLASLDRVPDPKKAKTQTSSKNQTTTTTTKDRRRRTPIEARCWFAKLCGPTTRENLPIRYQPYLWTWRSS